ncbi:biotin carboxylase N-terminal domain-containing protein, partial [Nocardia farcinica]|uniref:biotin carboxylase N-terminal domain-containing protein n=1 Tax=Nocardia farcinica TaxID=37329 RepID=UPI002454FF33
MRVVVVNRGEIAVRIVRAARAHGYRTLVVHTPAEAATLPVRLADDAVELPGEGAAAYLDIPAVVAAAPPPRGGGRVGPGVRLQNEDPALGRGSAPARGGVVGPR